jgi:hypothetical protein
VALSDKIHPHNCDFNRTSLENQRVDIYRIVGDIAGRKTNPGILAATVYCGCYRMEKRFAWLTSNLMIKDEIKAL